MIATVILSLSLGIAFVIQTLHSYGCKLVQCIRHDATTEETAPPPRPLTPVPRPTLIVPDLTLKSPYKRHNPFSSRDCITSL